MCGEAAHRERVHRTLRETKAAVRVSIGDLEADALFVERLSLRHHSGCYLLLVVFHVPRASVATPAVLAGPTRRAPLQRSERTTSSASLELRQPSCVRAQLPASRLMTRP